MEQKIWKIINYWFIHVLLSLVYFVIKSECFIAPYNTKMATKSVHLFSSFIINKIVMFVERVHIQKEAFLCRLSFWFCLCPYMCLGIYGFLCFIGKLELVVGSKWKKREGDKVSKYWNGKHYLSKRIFLISWLVLGLQNCCVYLKG